MFLLVIFTFFIYLYVSFWWKRRRMVELSKDVPSWCDYLPILGHAYKFIGDGANTLQQFKNMAEVANRHKGVVKGWIGPNLYYAITNPEDAEVVLNSCLEKNYCYKFAYPWVGNGLITANVQTWKIHHKKLLPAFNQNVLNGFMGIFNKQSSVMVKAMARELDKNEFDAYAYIGATTLETICQTAMGIPLDKENITNLPYLEAVHKILDVIVYRSTKIWLYPQFMYDLLGYKKVQDDALKILHHVSNTVVQKKKSEFTAKKKNKNNDPETDRRFRAFLDLMLELTDEDGIFTEQEIRDEVDTMIAAGQETTAYGVLFVLLVLGTHQEEQQKVYNEIREIFGDSDRDVTKEDLAHLVYLDASIKETLRLYPVVTMVFRQIDKELKLKHYTLPAGSNCAVSIWGLHRHERWGPDYDTFRPERWLDKTTLPAHPAAFAAFSYGRRACIGKNYALMSMKTMVVHILRSYRVLSDIKDMKMSVDAVIRPFSGHLLKIEKR